MSSETSNRIAALRLPSSNFEATACASWESADFLLLHLGGMTSGLLLLEDEYASQRFLMHEVRLCLLPPRLGTHKIVPHQLKIANQFARISGCAITLRRSPARCPAQVALADLGICLMSPQSAGVHEIPADWSAEAKAGAGDEPESCTGSG